MKPKVDFNKIPERDIERLCRIVDSGVRKLLETPEGKAEFEAWKKRRKEE